MWHETYDNVTALGDWLLKVKGFDAEALQAYYFRPWRWTKQWEEMQGAQFEEAA